MALDKINKPEGHKQSCRLLDMPAEIRNMIYRLVLTLPQGHRLNSKQEGDHRIVYGMPTQRDTSVRALKQNGAAILATNKQIHGEAQALLYTQPLRFMSTASLAGFLTQTSPSNRAILERIVVHEWAYVQHERPANVVTCGLLVEAAGSLKSILIGSCILGDPHGSPTISSIVERFYEDTHQLLEAVYQAHGCRVDDLMGVFRLFEVVLMPWEKRTAFGEVLEMALLGSTERSEKGEIRTSGFIAIP